MAKKKKSSHFRVAEADIKYYCEYDCEESRHCEEYGCHDEGICRCSTIDEVKIKGPLDIHGFVAHLRNVTVEDKYCIDRVLTILHAWDKQMWTPDICSGYYGEELNHILFDGLTALKADQHLDALRTLTFSQKIEYLLNLEYGFLLDEIKNKNWGIIEVKKEQIHLGQKDYSRKLDSEVVATYENYILPKAIAVIRGSQNGLPQYHVIDGYHRISANKSRTVKIVAEV